MSDIAEKWRAFCEWQKHPSLVPTMTEEHHRCTTCGQEFQGNYCPCCGQSARIGRYSFKNALLLFVDVWGMGNRGMFRTIRDLLLRPGYMIRDYISGMQMAYFPPFKMLFLLVALLLVSKSGISLGSEDSHETPTEQTVKASADSTEKKENTQKELTEKERRGSTLDDLTLKIKEFQKDNTAFFLLILAFFATGPLYLFFRKSPCIPDLRFSELLVAMVYILNMMTICTIFANFTNAPAVVYNVVWLLPVIPLKQMSGFKWWRTLLNVLVSYVIVLILWVIFLFAVVEILMYIEAS